MMKMMMMTTIGKGKGMGDILVTQADLGNIRPEGIATGPGSLIYTSELIYGGIKSVDVVTGEVKQVVESFGAFQRAAVGLWYQDGVIFAAGGGEILASCLRYTSTMHTRGKRLFRVMWKRPCL